MGPPLRASALRSVPGAKRAVTSALASFTLLGALVLAPAANAGQIVWSANNGIWAMNDDGSRPHQLISGVAPQLATSLDAGTVSAPDVFQNGGTTVLFLGQTTAFAPSSAPTACGADCSGTYALRGGTLSELGPPPAPAAGAAYFETQPRLTADGQELFGSALYTDIVGSSIGGSATALVERPLTAGSAVAPWSNTSSETTPVSGFDGAPDPADRTQAAWVEQQACNFVFLGQSACQYAVHVGGPSAGTTATVAIYDKEYVHAADGSSSQGPTSLAWSSDGTTLLMVDPYAPNTGIYAFAAAGDPATKAVTEVLAQPSGWTFGQARFAGSKIVFDAHEQVAGKPAGDIFTIPASCTAATCTFPSSATNLTNDPPANSADPAWTSATEPLASLRVAGGARVTKVALPSRSIRVGRRFTLVVTLSGPGTIVVRIVSLRPGSAAHSAPKSKSVGSLTFAGKAGSNRLAIGLVAGKSLAPASYTATISVRRSRSAAKTVHFTVRR